MLDIRKIKENPEGVKAALKAKEVDCDATIDRILELDEQRRALIADTETRKARQNKVSKDIPAMKKAGQDVSAIFDHDLRTHDAVVLRIAQQHLLRIFVECLTCQTQL